MSFRVSCTQSSKEIKILTLPELFYRSQLIVKLKREFLVQITMCISITQHTQEPYICESCKNSLIEEDSSVTYLYKVPSRSKG